MVREEKARRCLALAGEVEFDCEDRDASALMLLLLIMMLLIVSCD